MGNTNQSNTAKSFAAYIQQNKNSTNTLSKLENKSIAQKLVEADKKKKADEERLQAEFQINNLVADLNRRTFETQMNMVWDQMPEGAREEARFRAALNPDPIEIEPKNVSYEEAKRIFDEYDYYVDNPITYREYQKLPIDQKRKLDPIVVGANSFADYVILRDPESLGYTRPRTEIENEGLARRVYNQELTTSLAEYNRRQSENIDLDKVTNTAWDSYLQGLHGSTEVQFDKKKQREGK